MGGALPRWPQKEEECGKASGQFCVQPGHGNSSCPRTPRSPGEDAADWGPPSSSSDTTGSHTPLPWGAHTLRVLPGISLRPHPPRRPWMTDDLRNPRALSSPRAPARSTPVMLAEIVKLFHPRLVDLHNYIPTCNANQKLGSWSILNRRGFTAGFLPPPFLLGPHSSLSKAVLDGSLPTAPPSPWDNFSGCVPAVGLPDTVQSNRGLLGAPRQEDSTGQLDTRLRGTSLAL